MFSDAQSDAAIVSRDNHVKNYEVSGLVAWDFEALELCTAVAVFVFEGVLVIHS